MPKRLMSLLLLAAAVFVLTCTPASFAQSDGTAVADARAGGSGVLSAIVHLHRTGRPIIAGPHAEWLLLVEPDLRTIAMAGTPYDVAVSRTRLRAAAVELGAAGYQVYLALPRDAVQRWPSLGGVRTVVRQPEPGFTLIAEDDRAVLYRVE